MRFYRKRINSLQGDSSPVASIKIERYKQDLRELSAKQKRLPASDPLDMTYRRLFYTRYADDYLIGIIGSKEEAEGVFKEIQNFLNATLKLDISEEKSGIHHAKEGTSFLGYVVQNYSGDKVVKIRQKDVKVVSIRRSMNDRIQLRVPNIKLSEFCQRKGYGNYESLQPSSRPSWIPLNWLRVLLIGVIS
jgi:hypothetical protein